MVEVIRLNHTHPHTERAHERERESAFSKAVLTASTDRRPVFFFFYVPAAPYLFSI